MLLFKTLSLNFVLPNFLIFTLHVAVEEMLVCVDRSQPAILQGFNCRGGELMGIYSNIIAYFSFNSDTVPNVCHLYHFCVTSGL